MPPLDELAVRQVNLPALRKGLAMTDPRSRTEAALAALSWDRPGAEVEWAPVPYGIGRLTLGSSPTSASVVAAPDPARLAWHAGFRWCVSMPPGALEWVDLEHGRMWRGTGEGLNVRTLSGLTARGFARTARLEPQEVSFLPASHDLPRDPSQHIAAHIKQWWEQSCQRHLTERSTQDEKDGHKDRFTRFVAGVLLLRTIEDMGRVTWLPRHKLLDAVNGKAPADNFRKLTEVAAERLNSRVIRGIARDLNGEVARSIVRETYNLKVNFAELDVDPVGAFYEEILGIDYEHEPKRNLDLFGNNLLLRADRNARRAQGVYYTPRIYADTLARKLVRPAVRAAESVAELPIVADIAAGSGELLCAALREILSEPTWNQPDVAWEVLDAKLYGVDKNPLAPQLAALNLLRTAIRYVPELLDGERPLPSMDKNLRQGDALMRSTIDTLPQPDVVLINPPFRTPNRWRLENPGEAIPELAEVPAHPDKALAFFAAAVRLAQPGTGLGVVLPSGVLSGPLSATWRRWLAEHVRFDLVVANYGTPFRDVYSYAGLVVGEKIAASDQWRSRTRVVRVSGSIDKEMDTGVLLSEAGDSPGITSRVEPPILGTSVDWIGGSPVSIRRAPGRRPLLEVMGDSFHKGIVLAPKPWMSGLFLFRRLDDGQLQYVMTGKIVGRLRSPCLRPFVNAKKVHKIVPLWCDPFVAGLFVFVPSGGGAVWSVPDALAQENDPDGHKLGQLICDTILGKHEVQNSQSAQFVEHASRGELRFSAPKGFRDTDSTLVYASRTTVTAASRGQGRAWYAWVNLGGDVVPVSGLQMRVPRPAYAAALVAWMSQDSLVATLVERAAQKLDGSVELNLQSVAEWSVPDLREDRYQARLDELYAAFLDHRAATEGCTPADAFTLPSYREVQQLALALWEHA